MPERQADIASSDSSHAGLVPAIVELLRDASIEINVQDVPRLEVSRAFLSPGTKVYVSHLPKQTWQETGAACRAVHDAGFVPVPHIPTRLLPDAATFDSILADFVGSAVQEVLLIAGDYPQALGPYPAVTDVMRSGLLAAHGLKRVSVAGHPEGHPVVSPAELRQAEHAKDELATQAGQELTFLTQFFFEPAPFLAWVQDLRAREIGARIVGGLAGPARASTLFKFAVRCGVGPSIRALGTRPTALLKLVGEHGPDRVIRALAQSRSTGETDFNGIHFFCFGGYLRTCEWLHQAARGDVRLNDHGGFDVGVGSTT